MFFLSDHFANLINYVPENVPRLLINRDVVAAKPPLPKNPSAKFVEAYRKSPMFAFYDPENHRDALFQGACDEAVEKIADALGWREELEKDFKAPITRAFKP